MLVLGFDTATPAATVALHDGERVLAESTTVDAMRHGELLAPGIAAVLDKAGAVPSDLTEIAVGVGPGPFTGLRVGLVTARTLGHVLGVPVRGVCTLDVLAAAAEFGADVPETFLVATDARRKEVYWARYNDQRRRVEGPHVARPADIATRDHVVGRGATLYSEAFPNAVGPANPSAGDLAGLASKRAVPLLEPVPLYLRRPDAVEPGARKSVLTSGR
ncbi:tRNA (adenosine(37)-N6)-threonylcarbamoyltransferase complex dimerization subunit type 1 TsaB [Flindersiella endophytica]